MNGFEYLNDARESKCLQNFSDMSKCMKSLMYLKHISVNEMSALTGISKSWIQDYIDGKRVPRGYHLTKVAKALDITESYLLEQCKNKRGITIV